MLGWCVPCRYAASQGGKNNPFIRAEYLVSGIGMCPTCMLSLLNLFYDQTQLNSMTNVAGRQPNQGG